MTSCVVHEPCRILLRRKKRGWVHSKRAKEFQVFLSDIQDSFGLPPLEIARGGQLVLILDEEPQLSIHPPAIMMFHMLPGSMLYPSPNGGRNDPYSM